MASTRTLLLLSIALTATITSVAIGTIHAFGDVQCIPGTNRAARGSFEPRDEQSSCRRRYG
jgi:hypothetical protein